MSGRKNASAHKFHSDLPQPAYPDGNFAFVKDFLARELPEAVMYIPEAAHLAWADMGKCLPDFFANRAGVLPEGGNALFVGSAAGYVRLNPAMPRSTIEAGLVRMVKAIRAEQGGADSAAK